MQPNYYSSADIAKALRATDGKIFLASQRLGCCFSTIYKRIAAEPELQAVVEEARGQLIDIAETSLKKAVIEGQAWAVCFTLKTQGRDRGYIERHEHRHGGDENAPPIQVANQIYQQFAEMSDDEVKTRCEDLALRFLLPARRNGKPPSKN